MDATVLARVCLLLTVLSIVTCIQVRLTGGRNRYGRLELARGVGGPFSAVCSKNFGQYEADLVCKELGYLLGGSFWNYSLASDTTAIVKLHKCTDEQTSLSDCNQTWGISKCDECQAIAVACAHKMRVRDVTELLRREFGSYLEMYLNGTWQGVCADPHVVKSVNAGNSKGAYALKACEAAGFGVGVKHKAGKLWKDAYGGAFYTGHDRVMLHANCNGTEDDIYSCDGFSVEKVPDDSCDVAYLRCYDTYFDDIRPLVGPFCGAPNPSFGDLLFSPSEDGAEHHICYNAITGAVISHGSKSLNGIRTGVITSPNWPGESPSFIDCRWFLEFAMLSGKAFRTLELDTYFPSPPSSDLLEFRSADAWWGGYQFNDSMFEDDLYGFLQTEGECLHSKDICLEGFTLQNYNSSVSIKKEVIGATEELAIRYLSLSHTPANTDSGRKHAFRYKWRYFLYGETSGIYPLRSAGLYLLLAFALVVQV